MTNYYLGADLGGTKTHVMIADTSGQVLGFGESGPGNHESVGYDGFKQNLTLAVTAALKSAGITAAQISGAGYGIGGYDWPMETVPHMAVINSLGLGGKVGLVNDSELGLLSGSPRGWGVAVVSGTGCNCCGWDASREHRGRVTGGGLEFGEMAGAGELSYMVKRAIAFHWTGRGPATALSQAFIEKYKMADLADLLQNLVCQAIDVDASDAPLVFKVAAQGDPVANDIIRWAGRELGEMAVTVIRQLKFEDVDFDLVQIGGMFDGSPLLTEEMKRTVLPIAPKANFIRNDVPPVVGAVLFSMEACGINPYESIRSTLYQTMRVLKNQAGVE